MSDRKVTVQEWTLQHMSSLAVIVTAADLLSDIKSQLLWSSGVTFITVVLRYNSCYCCFYMCQLPTKLVEQNPKRCCELCIFSRDFHRQIY